MTEFPRIEEVDEVNTSSRFDTSERLQTEYTIDNTEEQLAAIELELMNWFELGIAILVLFMILITRIYINFPIEICLAPLIFLDLRVILKKIFQLKSSDLNFEKEIIIRDIIEVLSVLVCKILIILYIELKCIEFIYIGIPVGLPMISRLIVRGVSLHECQSFSEMFLFFGKVLRFTTIICVGLKLDGYVHWDWIGSLWPLWVALCFMSLMSIGVFLLMFGSLFSYCSGESNFQEVISTFWLFYAVAGFSASMSYFLYNFAKDYNEGIENYLLCVPAIIYLGVFLAATYYLKPHLVKWWSIFFVNNDIENSQTPIIMATGTLPLPPSQARMSRRKPSFSQRIITAVKKPPKALVRLSSTYFRPADHQFKLQKLRNRTKSAKIDNSDINFQNLDISTHKRTLSTAASNVQRPSITSESPQLRRNPSDANFANKTCSMCCENLCNAVIMECGHGGICYECSLKLWKSQGFCHMCRAEITQVLQINVEPSKVLKVLSTTRAVYGDNEDGNLSR